MDLRERLQRELRERQSRNRRYSLRAFAAALGVSHSTLSRMLHRRGRLTASSIARLGERLGLTPAEVREARLAEQCELLLSMVDHPDFRADARWLAQMTGTPIDDVQTALHWLLHTRRLTMSKPSTWTARDGEPRRALADHLA